MAENENTIKYQNLGQVGAMGDNARVDFLVQNQDTASNIDYSALMEELNMLRQGIEEETGISRDDKDQAIVAIQEAKVAVREKDSTKIGKILNKCGNWLLSVAEKLSIQVVAGLIKDSLHHSP